MIEGGSADRDLGVTIEVVGEDGRPVPGAVLNGAGTRYVSDDSGRIRHKPVQAAEAGAIQAAGYLDEPLVLGPENAGTVVRVSLWESRDGARISYHAGGDVMLGRRYISPEDGSNPVIDGDMVSASARGVFSAVAPLFSAATLSTINLESVVDGEDAQQAYPAKRFIISTPPDALAGLQSLGVDVVLGANNHARDYLDNGIDLTRKAVENAGIQYSGAGRDKAEAARPAVLKAGAGSVEIFAYSTPGGDEVNDAYRAVPGPGAPDWLSEERAWGYSEGANVFVPRKSRTIGAAWEQFQALESQDRTVGERAWDSLYSVYPELQDWEARRGHGGANGWDPVASPQAIQAAAATEALVVVQFHSGFQYTPWKASGLVRSSRAAIDSGADIVIAHHPHVLQGFEWYRGRLIVYSLGNFAFDQDILSTFAGGFLRTVWEGEKLLDARFIPLVIKGYRPLPVAGVTASRLLHELTERSAAPVTVGRASDGRLTYEATPASPAGLPSFAMERNTLLIKPPLDHGTQTNAIVLAPGQDTKVETNGLFRPLSGPGHESLSIGHNRFPYGTFDDVWSGGSGALFWDLGARSRVSDKGQNGTKGLELDILPGRTTLVRPTGRIQLFDPQVTLTDGSPAWSAAEFELSFWVRAGDEVSLTVRLDYYAFDDTDPTVDPVSEKLAAQEMVVPSVEGSGWREVRVPLQRPAGTTHVLPYFLGESSQPTRAMIDNVEFIEWRPVSRFVNPFTAPGYLLNDGPTELSAMLDWHPFGRP